MSNSFNLLEHASNSDPLEIASSAKKEVKQEKPKVEEKKPVQQQRKPKPTTAPVEDAKVLEGGFQGTRSKTRGGRQQHQGYQPPKKGRTFDRHVSGTGRGKEVKKGGSGKANWGKATEQKEEKPEQQVEQSEAVGEQQPPVEEKKEETPSAPVDTSLTLDEYFGQKKSSKISLKKEAGEQLVTGKTVKLSETAFERSSDELFQKEKKKVEKTAEKKSAASKPKTLAVSEFLDTASIEKIKERRDKELLEGPKQPRGPRQDRQDRPERAERGDRKGGKPQQNKGQKGAKPASTQKKPRPVINKEKDFPALSPQN